MSRHADERSGRHAGGRGSHAADRGAQQGSHFVEVPERRGSAHPDSRDSLSSGAVGTRPALGGKRRMSEATVRATRSAHARPYQRGRRRSGARTAVSVGLALVFIALVAVFVVPRVLARVSAGGDPDRPAVEPGQQVNVVIAQGAGASEIAQQLYQAGVIDSTEDFYRDLRRLDSEQSLKSGSYVLVTGSDPVDVINQLVAGPNGDEGRLTVPEGYTVAQVAAAAESSLGVSADGFVAQAKASSYVADYPFLADAAATSEDSLEGYLFPKTYDFAGQEVTADLVIRTMLDQYAAELANYDTEAARAQLSQRFGREFSDYDVLVVASIVEKETNTPKDDGAHVASVIYNRLASDMPLQCDSTSVYANGGTLTSEIVSPDYDSPYNTYRVRGLPPTPIAAPSIASFEAALYPDRTDDLYFFISGDYHVFSQTYEQHQQAIAAAPSSSES